MTKTNTEIEDMLHKGWVEKYGVMWRPWNGIPRPDWMIERDAYLRRYGCDQSEEWMGESEHFERYITHLFGHAECDQPYVRNPNTERISQAYFGYKYVALAGHVSSGKTRKVAFDAVGEFLADPKRVGVLLTSTTIPDSRLRIWGDVERGWNYAKAFYAAFFSKLLGKKVNGADYMPGELISSSAMIRFRDPETGDKDDARGLKLIPGSKEAADEGINRLKGFKAPVLRLKADELSDLSPKVVEASYSTLSVVTDFKVIASLNPGDIFDPGGVFCRPKEGWESVDCTTLDKWETERGICLRFDAEKSPNVVLGYCKYPGLIERQVLEEQRKWLGDNSPLFQRNYRAIWPTGGRADSVFTIGEVFEHGGKDKAIFTEIITPAVGVDPSFSHGGDRCPWVVVWMGFDENKRMIVEYGGTHYLDDNLDTQADKKIQIVNRIHEQAKKFRWRDGTLSQLNPRCFGIDTTGAGDVIASWLTEKWAGASNIHKVCFSDAASDVRTSNLDAETGRERFEDKMSEIWYTGKDLLRGGQLRNLPDSIIDQIRSRNYMDRKGRIKLETKKDMKKRIGMSPDEADAFFIALDVLVQHFNLRAGLKPAKSPPKKPKDPHAPDFSPLMKKPGKSQNAIRLMTKFNIKRELPNQWKR